MKLTLIRGLPGSGKSTLAKKIAATQGAVHVENDMFIVDESGVYCFDQEKLTEEQRWCFDETALFLRFGKSVVVSNCFVRRDHMRQYIDLANDCGAELRIIEAQGCWPNIHNVPNEVIVRMRRNWEPVDDLLELYA